MCKKLLVAFCLFYTLFAFAKPKTLLNETFSDNQNDWAISSNAANGSQLVDGHYVLDNSNESNIFNATLPVSLDPFMDYSIETSIKQTKGVENFGYGLIFGGKDASNFFAFTVTGSGYYLVYFYNKGHIKKLTEWQESSAINTTGNYNVLKISKTKGVVYFYINGTQVFSMQGRNYYSNHYGFILNNKMTIAADFLKIEQEAINVPRVRSFDQDDIDKVLYTDGFKDNRHRWIEEETEESKAEINSKGYYYLKHNALHRNYFSTQYLYFNEFESFQLSATIDQLGGSSESEYGIIYGMKDKLNYYTFTVSSDGYYHIYGSENGYLFELKKWSVAKDIINPVNRKNKLTILKKGTHIHFFVNNKLVHSDYHRKFFGHRFGLNVGSFSANRVYQVSVKIPHVAIKLISNSKQGYAKKNLGGAINTPYEELGPIISADGNTLYILRDEHPENITKTIFSMNEKGEGNKKTIYTNDIWVANKQNGTWNNAQQMGAPLNNEGHNFVISVSPDNNQLLVANEYLPDGKPGGDGISLTRKTAEGWQTPQKVAIENDYNHNKFVSYFLSSDNKHLIMSLEQDDSYGDLDLYISTLKKDGSWSKPINMGPQLNSRGSESTAFLAADNRTLYFSSNGWPGYGSNDIFVSRRLDNSWTRWSIPQNLGPEVNTDEWEGYYSVPASGDYAYLASYTNSIGMSDIFQIKIHDAAKPDAVMLLKGVVRDKKTNEGIGTKITIYDLDNDIEVAEALSNAVDGSFEIVLPKGGNYSFYAEKKGYHSLREAKDLSGLEAYREVTFDLSLAPLEQGESFVLNNIFFIQGKNVLKPHSYPELNKLVQQLNENPNMKILVEGHTDNVGKPELNLKLSEERAEVVANYLIKKGVTASRISSKGYGGTKPVASNNSESTRKLNRRVEFRILED